MSWRIIDISEDGRSLSAERQSLVVKADGEELGRVPLGDLHSIHVHAHHARYSHDLLAKLAERGIPLLVCDNRHDPTAILWPVRGHHEAGARVRLQADAPKPVMKRLWRDLVRAKIREQAHTLQQKSQARAKALGLLVKTVRSGDPDNREARAARLYWKALFGPAFSRDREASGLNAHLNYGYAVIRSGMARAVVAAGLTPALGVGHVNRRNPFALVDDLIEPFRPLVDRLVYHHREAWCGDLSREAKATLAGLMAAPIAHPDGETPLSRVMALTVASLVAIFDKGAGVIDLPPRIEITPSPVLPGFGAS